MSSSNGKVFFGFVLGAAVGVAAGLLFAPASGKDTREKIKEKGKEYSDELAKQIGHKIDDLKDYVGHVAEDTNARVKKAANQADQPEK
ncbi:MAG: YtxH domain-containing protein [Bacteroidales bacterium]|nr:YtxH domain-containing protein [Bacteroidales bacterium]